MATLLRIFILIVPFWSLAHASKCDNMPEGDNKSLCAALDQKASRFCDLITNQDTWIRQQRQTLKSIRSTLPHYIHNASL